jgi:hypothetical protein
VDPSDHLFGLSGSGGPLHAALLTSVKPGGPDIATGGTFGPDGRLIQLAVLVIGVALIVSSRRMSKTIQGTN